VPLEAHGGGGEALGEVGERAYIPNAIRVGGDWAAPHTPMSSLHVSGRIDSAHSERQQIVTSGLKFAAFLSSRRRPKR